MVIAHIFRADKRKLPDARRCAPFSQMLAKNSTITLR
jgi:hypothetical protein